ncbi:hypothetical protein [Novilysobacter erysipheiresistens]|uniref:Portal protein n=1 Tax=Novilysobacter erysipheiresistens TaxID=1749332 RepID=A0ABU7YUD4_9GAMM
MNSQHEAMDAGIEAADGPDKTREYADVKAWFDELEAARKFDEPARKQYAKDRRYARGDTRAQVATNIAGTNIDVLESFLYAKDPDMDITPGPTMRPPSVDALRDAAEEMVAQSPEVMQAGQQAAAQAILMGMPQPDAMLAGQMASEAKVEELIQQQVDAMQKRYQKRQRDMKAFCETAEIIGSHMWGDASLKRRGRPWVRSSLTIGIGVMKASWQERTAPSPETVTAINDLQQNIARARAQAKALEEGEGGMVARLADGLASLAGRGNEAKLAEFERQLSTLQAQPEPVISRGFVVDNVAGEDFQVAPGYTIANHLDAPWNAHRVFMPYDDAVALALANGVPEEKMRQAVRYTARKPVMIEREAALVDQDGDAKDADAYVSSNSHTAGEEGCGEFVALWEKWDRDTNTVLTSVEGVKCWVKPAWNPPATTRFYPFFLMCDSEVDGQRHPQSKTSRAAPLLDEYNRIGSAEAEHRRRVLPKTMFNAGAMEPGEADKLAKAITQEMVAVKTTVPKMDLRGLIQPVAYAQIDPALYDRQRIIQEIERIYGTQEALAGSIQVEKTATEAEIQQTGFQARTGGQRDKMEGVLSELARYTIEIARAYIDHEQAIAIAGDDALWPEYGGPDDLLRTVTVDIRGGSSGKPNTRAERDSWSALLPMLQTGIMQIAQLRSSSPLDVADAMEKLLRITAERSGERLDIDDLLPPAGIAPMPGAVGPDGQPVTPPDGAPPTGEPEAPEQDPAMPMAA